MVSDNRLNSLGYFDFDFYKIYIADKILLFCENFERICSQKT